uniref:Multiple inositol polyphosphate phosphatase 1 n=1 Tax=Strigamia maritima TaxID=126957 RepID=T1IUT4_STRMM
MAVLRGLTGLRLKLIMDRAIYFFKMAVSRADVDVMYNGCRYETAWFPTTKSPWCALFRNSDFELLELIKDIDFYMRFGYDSEINYKQACPIVRDIVQTMQWVVEDSVASSVAIRFSHSGAMVKLFARLGLFNDSKSIVDLNEKRAWRTSFLDPFSSNLCLVLFKCRDQQFRILTYLQEKVISLPVTCAQPCMLGEFFNYYKSISDSCNMNEICNME